jgi:hypothetical protein
LDTLSNNQSNDLDFDDLITSTPSTGSFVAKTLGSSQAQQHNVSNVRHESNAKTVGVIKNALREHLTKQQEQQQQLKQAVVGGLGGSSGLSQCVVLVWSRYASFCSICGSLPFSGHGNSRSDYNSSGDESPRWYIFSCILFAICAGSLYALTGTPPMKYSTLLSCAASLCDIRLSFFVCFFFYFFFFLAQFHSL